MSLFSRNFGQFISRPIELEDGHPPRMLSVILYIVFACVSLLFVWASFSEIKEVASTKGELTPQGKIKTISHLEGGIIEKILVRPGDQVKVGQTLATLSGIQVSSELNRVKSRLNWLKLEEIRLRAEISGERPDFSKLKQTNKSLILLQQATYEANVNDQNKIIAAIEDQIEHTKLEIKAHEKEVSEFKKELAIKTEVFNIQNKLSDQGYTSRIDLLDRKASYQKAQTAVFSAIVRLEQAKEKLSDATRRLHQKQSEVKKSTIQELAKVVEEKISLQHRLRSFKDQFNRLSIRSPIDGLIKEVVPKNTGAVIAPGKDIIEVVPTTQELVAEVRIQTKDIGHVKLGDTAELVITTYDFNVYGKLLGKLTDISASSFKDDDGKSYFRGYIAIDRDNTNSNKISSLHLLPGMQVDARIITGSKSVLKYLLKPIYRSIDVAFSER